MGFYIHLVIESKDFYLSRDGNFLLIIEKGRKFMHEMWLGWATGTWFAHCLETYRKNGNQEDYFAKTREGIYSFIAQHRSNSKGSFVVLEEYGGDGKCGSIIIPEEKGGEGVATYGRGAFGMRDYRRGPSRDEIPPKIIMPVS